jgi:hypothetical protein
MTYASAGLIQAADYNGMANTLAAEMGSGSGAHGLGQAVSSYANVTAGTSTVTAAQWTNLIAAINAGLTHKGQATIAPTSVTAGNTITYYAPINTGSSLVYNTPGATGLALSDGAANTTSFGSAWGTTGSRGLAFTQSLTFASADAARYFFNAGGTVKLSYSRSGGSATTRNTEWTALASNCGALTFGWYNTTKVGGGGSAPTIILNANNGGYWSLTGTWARHFLQYDNVGSYSNNYIDVYAYWSGSTSNGGYNTINFLSYWINSWTNVYQDAVDGTCSTSVVVSSPASGIYLTNTWTPSGAPTFSGTVSQV